MATLAKRQRLEALEDTDKNGMEWRMLIQFLKKTVIGGDPFEVIGAKVRATQERRKSGRKKNGFTPCIRSRCHACIQSERASEHRDHKSGKTWKIEAPLNCQSTNVVYKLGCRKCGPFVYIGETSRRFCDRLADHRGYINRKRLDTQVGNHFNLPGHVVTDLKPLPIEKVLPEGDNQLRRERERFWIQQYDL